MKKAGQYAPHPLNALVFFAWVLAVQLTGLAAFTKGFFLTRVELGRESPCDIQSLLSPDELQHLSGSAIRQQQQQQERGGTPSADPRHPHEPPTLPLDGCWLPPRFKRVVWVVVDALRYDFAAFSPTEGAEGAGLAGAKPHSAGARHYLNHLPIINEAIGGGGKDDSPRAAAFEGSGGMLFQFEADPPTVTMQRLKGLTTGGLPTFIDFRDNFHSPEIAEDNWVSQVRQRAAGRRRRQPTDKGGASAAGGDAEEEDEEGEGEGGVVFMGDDTWTSLYPTYFSRSYPFPSFNTRDLHTVDDGVLAHLSTELASRDWDVLVAHFLGVDHVGHTFGPASQAMEDKLDQMNAALRTVFEGVDDDTVVFVLGDHGMTEDGNHGGATPEETGAALLVWSPSGERLLGPGFLQRSGVSGDDRRDDNNAENKRGMGDGGGEGGVSADRRHGGGFHVHGGADAGAGAGAAVGESDTPDGGRGGDGGARNHPLLTGREVAQIDLVPTISLLLGTPIPFGSLGGVIPEVFVGPYYGDDGGGDGREAYDGGWTDAAAAGGQDVRDPRHLERLCDALLVNSVQVWRYLSEYAGVASMPTTDMFDLKELLLKARDAHTEYRRQLEWRRIRSGTNSVGASDLASSAKELRRVCDLYRKFLDASIGLGRSLWTQYDTSLMWWGLAVLLAATVALAFRAVASSIGPSAEQGCSSAFSAGYRPSGTAATAAAGAAASLAIAASTDAVFGSSGAHVFAAKVALCSSLGVCIHYAQQTILNTRAPTGRGSGTDSDVGNSGRIPGKIPGASPTGARAAATTTGGTATVSRAFTVGLSVLYCGGLFSNSFIEAEDGLHRFLGASSLLSLAVLFLLVPAPTTSTAVEASCLSPPGVVAPGGAAFTTTTATATSSVAVDTEVIETAEATTSAPGRSGTDISRRHHLAAAAAATASAGETDGTILVAESVSTSSAGNLVIRKRSRRGDRVGLLLGLSPTSTAGMYAALAAGCLRAATAVQASAAESGVPAESAFGAVRSLLPLPALWLIGRRASGGGTSSSGGKEEKTVSTGTNTSPAPWGVSTGGGGGGRSGGYRDGRNKGLLAALWRSAVRCCCSHGALRALSLAAAGAYWVNEAITAAAAGAGLKHGAAVPGAAEEAPPTASPFFGWLPAMRLLLPRATYLLCLVGLVAALLNPPVQRPKQRGSGVGIDNNDGAPMREGGDRCDLSPGVTTPPYAHTLADTAGTVVSHLVPAVVLVLGPGSPAVVMFLSAACGCVLRSVTLAAAGTGTGVGAGVAGVPLGAVAVAWSVVGRAFFFLTGHHNQFSRLQYSAAFIGFDEFDFKIGGLLLFLNTFGTEILAALALPLAAAATAAIASGNPQHGSPPLLPLANFDDGGSRSAASVRDEEDRRRRWWLRRPSLSSSRSPPSPSLSAAIRHRSGAENNDHTEQQGRHDDHHHRRRPKDDDADDTDHWAGASRVLSSMEQLSGLTLLFSSFRTFLSAANVSVQRGHLMLWAVFAPKFVFDATMQAVCGAAAVLAWGVVLVAHRGFSSFPRERRGGEKAGRGGGRGGGHEPRYAAAVVEKPMKMA